MDLKRKKERRSDGYFIKVARWMLISLIKKQALDGTVSISDVIHLVASGAFYFVILLFSFPVALPFPYPPGFPSICGVPLFLLSIQMVLNKKKVILPQFVLRYRIKTSIMTMVVRKSGSIFRFLSKIIKPQRMQDLASEKLTVPYGILFFILSICILIPLPGTNFIPAVGIFICSLGLLFKDGLLAFIGGIIGIIGLAVIYFLGEFFVKLMNWLF